MKSLLHLALLIALAAAPAFGQARSKRLILKDGSHQAATKWEVKADRVRYFSAERYMWEELPNSLVDWPATTKFEQDLAAGRVRTGDAEPDPMIEPDEPEPPTVAPGLQLPDSSGIYLLDQFQGQPRLVEVVQNGSEVNQQRGKNILRSVINPIPSGPSQTVELRGAKASVQSHTLQPVLYVNVNFDNDDDASRALPPGLQRFHIVRLEKKDKEKLRVISNLKYSLTGRVKERRELVPTRSEQLTKDWIKVTALEPLPPGEYAVVEMLNDKQMNLYVWDFGVDPNAPANRMTWSPRAVQKIETGTNESPILNPRKN